MADVNAIVHSDYSVDTDGPFRQQAAGDAVSVPTISLTVFTVATAPAGNEGDLAYFSDGNAGAKCFAVHNGTDWKVVALGATIAGVA